jgi:hypothetical protein
VFDLISKRQVSFEMVRDIFTEMTAVGGVFFEQQKKQAETLSGQISVLRDAFDKMLNSMGKANEGSIKGAVGIARSLVDNYEQVWAVLSRLIIAFGIYKTVLIVNIALSRKLSIATIRNIVTFRQLVTTLRTSASAMAAFKVAGAPVLAILGLLAGAIASYSAKQKKLKEAMEETLRPIVNQGIKLRQLQSILNDTTSTEKERLKALSQLNAENQLVNKEILNEKTAIEELNKVLEENLKLNRVRLVLQEDFANPEVGLKQYVQQFESANDDLEDWKTQQVDLFRRLYGDIDKALSEGQKPGSFRAGDFLTEGAVDPIKAMDDLFSELTSRARFGSDALNAYLEKNLASTKKAFSKSNLSFLKAQLNRLEILLGKKLLGS